MIHSLMKLKGSMINSSDDFKVGEIKDFYFDELDWKVRYFVVNTGSWFSQKLILVSPHMVEHIDWGGFNITTRITKAQFEQCPLADQDKPVSRRYEEKFSRHYQIPYYWAANDAVWPENVYTNPSLDGEPGDTSLRSYHELIGYKIHARDDVFGSVQDLIIEDEEFKIEYILVDTSLFLLNKTVLVPSDWITDIKWSDKELITDLDKEQIQSAPQRDWKKPIEIDIGPHTHI